MRATPRSSRASAPASSRPPRPSSPACRAGVGGGELADVAQEAAYPLHLVGALLRRERGAQRREHLVDLPLALAQLLLVLRAPPRLRFDEKPAQRGDHLVPRRLRAHEPEQLALAVAPIGQAIAREVREAAHVLQDQVVLRGLERADPALEVLDPPGRLALAPVV